jgi:hypothetical protein
MVLLRRFGPSGGFGLRMLPSQLRIQRSLFGQFVALASNSRRRPPAHGDVAWLPFFVMSPYHEKRDRELDMASADGPADALLEIAGSTVVLDLSDVTFTDSKRIAELVIAGTGSSPTEWAIW